MALALPHKSKIGFDTIKFTVRFIPPSDPRNVEYLHIVDEDGELRQAAKFNELRGEFGNHVIQYKHFKKKGMFEFECSPYGVMYGQNVFVGSNLVRACESVMKLAAKTFGFDEATARDFMNAPVRLRRVDLVINIKLRDHNEVLRTLEQINYQFVNHKQTFRHGTTVYFQSSGGKRYVIAIYDKGEEMLANTKASKADDLWHQLKRESDDLLRIEVRLKAPELDHRHLDRIEAWTKGKGQEMFLDYASRMPLLEAVNPSEAPKALKKLNKLERQFYWLKLSQAPVETMFSKRAINDKERKLRKLGIDVKSRPTQGTGPTIKNLLTLETELAQAPKWLLDAGRAPRFKKRNRT